MTCRRLLIATLSVFLFGVPARALDPAQPAGSYLRTHFNRDSGLPGSVIDQVEQTRNGFLWLMTDRRYVERFDGKRFSSFYEMQVTAIAAAPDGDLWLGTPDGLLRVRSLDRATLDGSIPQPPGPGKAGEIRCIRFSRTGTRWVGTAAGLFRYDAGRFVPLGPRVPVNRIDETPDGNLLLTTEDGFMELAGSEVVPHPRLGELLGVAEREIFHVLRDRQGNTWYCTAKGVARETRGRIEQLGIYARNGHAAYRAYEDPEGTIWIAKDEGLFRATSAGLELVAAGMHVRSLYTDRDGNLWVGTNGDGLYRFKEPAARMFTTADGLPNDVIMAVIATRDGAVWTGANCGGVSRFDGKTFRTWNESDGLLNSCVFALAEDAHGDLWIGTWGGGAFHYRNGTFTQYSKGQGMADDVVTTIVAGRNGDIWFGTPSGLTRLRAGRFHTFTIADGLSANGIRRVFEDRAGVIWVGSEQGLDRVMGDRFQHFRSLPRQRVVPFGMDRNGAFFVAATVGGRSATHRFDKGRADTFIELGAYDMVEMEQGEIWFGATPICRVPPGAFARSRVRDEPLDYEPFSVADGLATAHASGRRSVALTRDGKLWIATLKGLAVFDLRRLPVTKAKPSIYLTAVTIGRNRQRAGREIVLPPGTSHVNIEFAAVEITSPEKIRMQYRLDDVDSEWLDAPADPHAIYTGIPAGTHALRIRACNRNGIWDRQGVVFTVIQQPYFYQTRWFVAAMLALGLLLVGLLYRLRVAQISRAMSARFDERLAERTRVAREIHDTFLQTVQGSKLVADHALKDPADHARMVRAMEQLSAWLGQATEEGRAALNSLRASTTERNDLAEALRRAIDECRTATTAEISFSVHGDAREMHPVVRDEIYRIAYEAIRNACTHSGGDRVEISLDYGHDLTLRISDNGRGIDPDVVEKGRESHFGLRGMRERAERIDGTFTMVSSPGSGTTIILVVPAY